MKKLTLFCLLAVLVCHACSDNSLDSKVEPPALPYTECQIDLQVAAALIDQTKNVDTVMLPMQWSAVGGFQGRVFKGNRSGQTGGNTFTEIELAVDTTTKAITRFNASSFYPIINPQVSWSAKGHSLPKSEEDPGVVLYNGKSGPGICGNLTDLRYLIGDAASDFDSLVSFYCPSGSYIRIELRVADE